MAGAKRSQEHENAQHEENIVLVDIEGTTTSISFVKETLFPYVRANLKDYIEKKWEEAEFKENVEKLKEQAKKDEADKIEGLIPITGESPEELKASLLKNILWQMDNDRKTGALKQLQGHIWRDGYKSGAIKGHLYEDVPKALEAWTKNGRKVYVYSSGSVEAQKLLFGHSEHGDLLKYFSGYFDTEVGTKQDAASYKNIITKIGCEPSNILFLTDIANEAKAAIESGMGSVLVVREGNAALTSDDKSKYTVIQSFQDLTFQNAPKRQKIEETNESEKEEVKKVEEPRATVDEPMDTVENNATTNESEKKVEKEPKAKTAIADAKQESKPADNVPLTETKKDTTPMECETTVEPEKSSKESEEVCTKKEVTASTVSQASTSEVDAKPATDTKTVETKVEEKVELKSVESSTSNAEEKKKTDSADKVNDASKKIESKIETDVDKKETNTDDKTKEPAQSEDGPKVDGKVEEIKEQTATKSEDKTPEEKTPSVVEEVKQNGDSKSETTESTSKTNVATAGVNGGVKNENTSPSAEVKESEKVTVESAKSDVAVDAEPAKLEPAKEDEKVTEEVVEKKLNGNTPTTTDKDGVTAEKTHRNGVNEEKKQNGDDDSMTDKESIKVKKVVDSIADGAGEPDVVPPVAVVAATS
ncbi:hypothetical protein PV328_003148 [Microctonus aethiopoides]|uniref:Enolase-phosphatase E1 n=1 Tax=Microctonus aethiopoides TaxID=144406 RepID=A0AA39KKC8_9HYME|nr:hypothetical protein PV328_003148 [Microctonus aethiopoides]